MLTWLTEPLSYDFMLRAFGATIGAQIVCAVLSCWLVLIGWSLMGDAVSHAVLPGVVLSYVVGVPFAVGAVVFGLLAVALIGVVRSTSEIKEDAAIGIVFTTLFALGLVLISITPSSYDLNHILFGSVLGVDRSDLIQMGLLGAVVLGVLLYKRRDLMVYAFDPVHAHVIGLSAWRMQAILLGSLALTAVVALQTVGVILVVAMLIIPGATAQLLTRRFGYMLLIAPGVSVLCAIVGLYISYHADTASGPTVVVVQGVVFFAVYLFAPSRGLLGQRRNPHRA